MFRRASLRFSIALAAIGLIAGSLALRAQDDNSRHDRRYKVPPPSAHIQVTVLRDYNGKPIADAHVIFHPVEGDKDKGSLELKTNEDGKTVIDVIPIGDTVRLQVIADGFQTFGQDYKIDKPEMSMEVRLKRPRPQYSTYNNSTANSGSDNNTGTGKSTNSSPNSAPPASGNKQSGPSDAQPNANQSPPQPK
ncbi:MAG: carboxypeptidase-like regulatory domain-containing protein [Terracidiphilus sp.]